MKFVTLTLGIAGTVIALGLTGIAVAAPTENAVAVTQWDISHENLVREFSQGLGADIDRPREQRAKKTKHSR